MSKKPKRAKSASSGGKKSAKFEEINPPNTLRAKVGNGSGMNPAFLKRAEAAMEEIRVDFEAHLFAEVDRISTMFSEMASSGAFKPRELYLVAHELRGQAGSFDYELLSRFGDTLCELLQGKTDLSPREVEVVGSHIDAMRAVVRRKVKGDGGDVGQELADGLQSMVVLRGG